MMVCSFLLFQVETVTDSEAETKGLPQFHSIGIQVEDKKRYMMQKENIPKEVLFVSS